MAKKSTSGRKLVILQTCEFTDRSQYNIPAEERAEIRRLASKAEVEEWLYEWAESVLPDGGPARSIVFRDVDGKFYDVRMVTSYELTVQELSQQEFESGSW
jgi:hypothetical protein